MTRHGSQALCVLELDRSKAEQLELFTLPFRVWQEGRQRRQASHPASGGGGSDGPAGVKVVVQDPSARRVRSNVSDFSMSVFQVQNAVFCQRTL